MNTFTTKQKIATLLEMDKSFHFFCLENTESSVLSEYVRTKAVKYIKDLDLTEPYRSHQKAIISSVAQDYQKYKMQSSLIFLRSSFETGLAIMTNVMSEKGYFTWSDIKNKLIQLKINFKLLDLMRVFVHASNYAKHGSKSTQDTLTKFLNTYGSQYKDTSFNKLAHNLHQELFSFIWLHKDTLLGDISEENRNTILGLEIMCNIK